MKMHLFLSQKKFQMSNISWLGCLLILLLQNKLSSHRLEIVPLRLLVNQVEAIFRG